MTQEPTDSFEPSGGPSRWESLSDMEKQYSACAVARVCEETAAHLSQFAKLLQKPVATQQNDIPEVDERELLKRIISESDLRSSHFDHHLGEAAWRSLFYLYLAELEQRRVRISDVCAGAGVPSTTALRYLDGLVADGLVCCDPHPLDRRIKFVRLTELGRQSLGEYLQKVSRLGRSPPEA